MLKEKRLKSRSYNPASKGNLLFFDNITKPFVFCLCCRDSCKMDCRLYMCSVLKKKLYWPMWKDICFNMKES